LLVITDFLVNICRLSTWLTSVAVATECRSMPIELALLPLMWYIWLGELKAEPCAPLLDWLEVRLYLICGGSLGGPSLISLVTEFTAFSIPEPYLFEPSWECPDPSSWQFAMLLDPMLFTVGTTTTGFATDTVLVIAGMELFIALTDCFIWWEEAVMAWGL
jgi:hypothetical protein